MKFDLPSFITSVKSEVVKNKYQYLLLGLVLSIAIMLRFVRLDEFITFLGDQGRDAIIMKRLITLEDFPGIGPRSSVGELFLGPFYYYLMAPALGIFQLNPIGPVFGVALLSILGLISIFFILKREINYTTAMLVIILATASYALTQLARFSWNPNLLPYFSFISLYLFYKTLYSNRIIFPILFGLFIGASIQLHYLMTLVFPGMLIFFLYVIYVQKHTITFMYKKIILTIGSFVFIFAPMILFELRNSFLNTKGFLGIFANSRLQSEKTSFFERFIQSFSGISANGLYIELAGAQVLLFMITMILLVVSGFIFFKRQKHPFLLMNIIVLSIYLVLFSFVDVKRLIHYYTPVYVSFYFLIVFSLLSIKKQTIKTITVGIFVLTFLYFNLPNQNVFKPPGGNYQIKIAQRIAERVEEQLQTEAYQLVSVPFANTNDHIRYFLEVWNKKPLPMDSTEPAAELYILCYPDFHSNCIEAKNDPQYQVVAFGDKKIDTISKLEGITILRIIHEPEN